MLDTVKLKEYLSYCPESGIFTWVKKTTNRCKRIAGCIEKNGYIQIRWCGKSFFAHRLAFIFMDQEPPKVIDHINGIKNDNRWCNLRVSNYSLNQVNRYRGKPNKNGYKGIFKNEYGKFVARIRIGVCIKHLGTFNTPEEAYIVFMKSLIATHGQDHVPAYELQKYLDLLQ